MSASDTEITVKEFEVESGGVFACCPIDLAPMVALGCGWVWGDQNMRSLAVVALCVALGRTSAGAK
jgi:hypothetical protein